MSQTVHTELSALATLYLTYLHCRPKTAQGDAEDTDMDNVSQELGLREGRRGSRRGSAHREGEQGEGQDGEVHEEYKERNGEDDDDEEESLQGISIQDGFTGGNSRPQAYSSTQQSQQRQQAQWQRTNQVQPQSQAQGQGRRPSTKPSGQQSPPPRQPSLAAEAAMQDRSGIESVNNYGVHSATESVHNGVPGSPVFLRGSRPHPSSSPLPRYMQAKGAGKR